jgi:F420-dependent oxidoreductase-like protein
MLEVAIMVEGQDGLNWPRWQRMARAVEDLGFAGLYRSDHVTNPAPPDLDSLELWISLAWLASHTKRIEFGPLVSPVSFRDPITTARMAAAVDDLSGGRLILGMGAGWMEREHTNYGWDLLDVPSRMDRFEEGLEVVGGLLHSDEPVEFSGRFYRLKDAILLPRPQRPGGPPLLIGGNGPKRTLPLAARFADEWNGVFILPERFAELNKRLDELIEAHGRSPDAVRRSLMVGTIFGRDETEVWREKEGWNWAAGKQIEEIRQRGVIAGTGDEFLRQLEKYAAAGVQRIMLQWLGLDDLDRLEALARIVLS